MNNQFIFYPELDIDLDKIKEIVSRHKSLLVPGLATHQRKINDEPYLIELQKKYFFFSNLYNIYTTHPNYKTPIHICPNRGCALNIPISYTEDSHTIFYEVKPDTTLRRNQERIYDVINEEDATEIFRYTLDRPTLMNTRIPHGVIGGPKAHRTIVSFSTNLDYDYVRTKKLLGG